MFYFYLFFETHTQCMIPCVELCWQYSILAITQVSVQNSIGTNLLIIITIK